MDISAALYYAVVNNIVGDLTSLLENGANPNEFYHDTANISSKYILHVCASKGHVECARILVDHGAFVLSRDNWYMTPIMHAAISKSHEVIDYLLTQCPEAANVGDKFGKKPLHYAVESDSVDTVRVLLKHNANVNSRTERGFTPLMALCSTRDLLHREELMQLLLDAGAEIELRDIGALRTALVYAAINRNIRDMETLLACGADPNTTDAAGRTPMTNVMIENIKPSQKEYDIDADVITTLLILMQSGAYLNNADTKLSNPMIIATYIHSYKIIQFLLDNGADPDVIDHKGWTPLMIAIYHKDIDTVRILLSSPCNLYVRAEATFKPSESKVGSANVDSFEMAVILRQWEIVNLLVLAGYNLSRVPYLSDLDSAQSVPSVFDDVPMFLSYLRELAATPMSLFRQTCLLIRRLLKTCVKDKAELLPLPVSLKQSVSLCNFDDYGVSFL